MQSRRTLHEALCGSEVGCEVKPAFAAVPGQDGDARLVAIVRSQLTASPADAAQPTCQTDVIWLVRLAGDGTVVDRQLVGGGCTADTAYGGACDGLPIVRVEPPASAAPRSVVVGWDAPGPGCGGWTRGSGDVEAELESFRVLRRRQWSGRAAGPDDSHSWSWDFTQLSFTSEWSTESADICRPRKRGPDFGVPQLELGRAFLDREWQQASFERCATTLHDARGVALPGTAKSAATLRAVLSQDDTLFVDVSEAPHAKPGASLRICFAVWGRQSYDYCRIGTLPDCARVSLDGRHLSGSVAVERARDKTRFRIQLPPDTLALGISYIEAGGRTLSNSAYLSGDATSLGQVFSIAAAVARCELNEGRLELELAPRRSDQALLDQALLDGE